MARTLLASTAAQLFAAADLGPASDALTLTLFAWAEAAELVVVLANSGDFGAADKIGRELLNPERRPLIAAETK